MIQSIISAENANLQTLKNVDKYGIVKVTYQVYNTQIITDSAGEYICPAAAILSSGSMT